MVAFKLEIDNISIEYFFAGTQGLKRAVIYYYNLLQRNYIHTMRGIRVDIPNDATPCRHPITKAFAYISSVYKEIGTEFVLNSTSWEELEILLKRL